MKKVGLLLVLVMHTAIGLAQHPNLVRFDALPADEKLLITWTTAKGFTCEDMTILAGLDTNSMETIYMFPGICGDTNKEATYSYTWVNPWYNQKIYLQMDLGTFGKSGFISARVKAQRAGKVYVAPNPVVNGPGTSVLYFHLPDGESAEIRFYNAAGRMVQIFEDLNSDRLAITGKDLGSGVYLCRIISGTTNQYCRFVVTD